MSYGGVFRKRRCKQQEPLIGDPYKVQLVEQPTMPHKREHKILYNNDGNTLLYNEYTSKII